MIYCESSLYAGQDLCGVINGKYSFVLLSFLKIILGVINEKFRPYTLIKTEDDFILKYENKYLFFFFKELFNCSFLKTYMALMNLEPVKKNEAAVRSLNGNQTDS